MIEFRLRIPLRVKSRQTRLAEAALGYALPPVVIPARTTLRLVDFAGVHALASSEARSIRDGAADV